MRLSAIEPDPSGCDVQTYACRGCGHKERTRGLGIGERAFVLPSVATDDGAPDEQARFLDVRNSACLAARDIMLSLSYRGGEL